MHFMYTRATMRLATAMIFACVAAMPGCGLSDAQRAGVSKFGTATAALAGVASDEFSQTRRDLMSINTSRAALEDPQLPMKRGTPDLDGPLDPEDVAARVEGVEALKSYGELLVKLATGSSAAEIQAASASLVTGLGKLKAAGKLSIDNDKLTAIGQAVAFAGSAIESQVRAEATRRVARETGPAVRQLAELVKNDFDVKQPHWTEGVMLAEQMLRIRTSDIRKYSANLSLDERARLAESEAKALAAKQRVEGVAKQIQSACDQLLLAEQDMRVLLAAPALSLDAIDPFVDKVLELKRLYAILAQ